MVEPRHSIIQPLNGARGVAALVVAVFHFALLFGVQLAPGGYLAVDLFFVLSGFVIAHAYDPRLGSGLGAIAFLRLRLRRFYPLYALGMVLGAAWLLLELIVSPPAAVTLGQLLAALALASFFLPYPGTTDLFPINSPAWSLLFELLVNLAYAALFRWLKVGLLLGVALVSAVILAVMVIEAGSANMGVTWDTVPGGVPRTIFSFSIGAVIYRLRDRLPTWRFGAGPLIAAICVPMIAPVAQYARVLVDLAAIFLVFPVAIALIARSTASPAAASGFATLGALSFPLYALHYPIMIIGLGMADYLPLPRPVTALLFLGTAIAVSLVVHYRFDEPLQRVLSRRTAKRSARPSADSESGATGSPRAKRLGEG